MGKRAGGADGADRWPELLGGIGSGNKPVDVGIAAKDCKVDAAGADNDLGCGDCGAQSGDEWSGVNGGAESRGVLQEQKAATGVERRRSGSPATLCGAQGREGEMPEVLVQRQASFVSFVELKPEYTSRWRTLEDSFVPIRHGKY